MARTAHTRTVGPPPPSRGRPGQKPPSGCRNRLSRECRTAVPRSPHHRKLGVQFRDAVASRHRQGRRTRYGPDTLRKRHVPGDRQGLFTCPKGAHAVRTAIQRSTGRQGICSGPRPRTAGSRSYRREITVTRWLRHRDHGCGSGGCIRSRCEVGPCCSLCAKSPTFRGYRRASGTSARSGTPIAAFC